MPLTSDEKRQIAQFLFIADHYLMLAMPAAAWQGKTMGNTKSSFSSPSTLTSEIREQAIIGAHLSSAAIRLATIEDVLARQQLATQAYKDCRDFFNGVESMSDDDDRARTCSDWLHVMLRDNAAHREPAPAPTNRKGRRYEMRQACVVGLDFAEAYEKLKIVAGKLRALVCGTLGVESFPSSS